MVEYHARSLAITDAMMKGIKLRAGHQRAVKRDWEAFAKGKNDAAQLQFGEKRVAH